MRNFQVDAPSCPNDVTHDGLVNVSDFLVVLGNWDTPFGDVTGDNQTNVNDILSVVGNWGACSPPPLRAMPPNLPTLVSPRRK